LKWEEQIKNVTGENINEWETALKILIKEGKKLGIPLTTIELLKKAIEKDI